MAIASVDGCGRTTLGDATGGGSLLPATRQPPKQGPIKLGRTYAPMKVQPVGRAAAAAVGRARLLAPPPSSGAPLNFGRPSPSYASPTGGEASSGASYAGPGYPADTPASSYYPDDPAPGGSPTAAGGAASPGDAASPTATPGGESQKMTLQQAQASGPAPVGYYVAGGAAVLAVGLGIWLFTK